MNAAVGLLATGGSTNHAIHLPAIARAAGIVIDWQDLDEALGGRAADRAGLSKRRGDVNHFQAAGGMAFVIATLSSRGIDPRRHA